MPPAVGAQIEHIDPGGARGPAEQCHAARHGGTVDEAGSRARRVLSGRRVLVVACGSRRHTRPPDGHMTLHRSFAALAFLASVTVLFAFEVGRALLGAHSTSATIAPRAADAARSDGSITFRGDYESGDRSQWLECLTRSAATCSVVRRPVRQGAYAGVFTAAGAGRGRLGESAANVAYLGDKLGSDSYYAWSTLFPRGFRTSSWANVHAFFPRDFVVPNCLQEHFYASRSRATAPYHGLFVAICAGDASVRRPQSLVFMLQRRLYVGHWNDYVVHAIWSHRSDGLFVVWHRVQGGPWTRVLRYRGPTALYQRGAPVRIGVSEGLNRPSSSRPATVYQDGFVRGDSFAAVTRAAFGAG